MTQEPSSRPVKIRQRRGQARKFKDTARELGCEEDESAFDEKLRRIVRQKPDKGKKPNDE